MTTYWMEVSICLIFLKSLNSFLTKMDNVVHQPRHLPDNELGLLEVILQALVRYLPVLRADPEVPQEILVLFRKIKMTGEMLYVIGCEPRPRNDMDIVDKRILAALSSIMSVSSRIRYIKREWEKNRINPKYMFNENVEEMVDLAVYIEQGLLDVPKPRDNIFGKRKNTEKL